MKQRLQHTLAVIKPDVLMSTTARLPSTTLAGTKEYGNGINGIPEELLSFGPLRALFDLIKRNGFEIEDKTFIPQWPIEEAERFYQEHEGRFFYQRLIAFMSRYD